MENPIAENHFDTAEELWDHLSPTRTSRDVEDEFLYRGQSDASWQLMPSIVRKDVIELFADLVDGPLTPSRQVSMEFQMLEHFVIFCDDTGIPTPSEAKTFRDAPTRIYNFGQYSKHPTSWPRTELREIMAMARMHGLPARMLDWSDNPYVAVYFAASDALRRRNQWQKAPRLAVWKLTMPHRRSPELERTPVYRAPGTISRNIVAQHGLFTILRVFDEQDKLFGVDSMENVLPHYPRHTLEKVTVPVTESKRLYHLCELIGLNSARMYPGADGARMAVMDRFSYSAVARSNEEILRQKE